MTRPRKLLWAAPFIAVPANPTGFRVTPTAEQIAAITGPGGVICFTFIYREVSDPVRLTIMPGISPAPEAQERPGSPQQLALLPVPGQPNTTARVMGHAMYMPFTSGMFEELKNIGSVGIINNTYYDFTGGYAFHFDGDPSEDATDIIAQVLLNGAPAGGGGLGTTALGGNTSGLHTFHAGRVDASGNGGPLIELERVDNDSLVARGLEGTNQLYYYEETAFSAEENRPNVLNNYKASGYTYGWSVTFTLRAWPEALDVPGAPEIIGKSDCNIKVFDILASLYVQTLRYDYPQITNGLADGTGKVLDTVIGASFVEGFELEQVVSDICYIYSIQREFTAQGVRFYKNKTDLDNLNILAQIDEQELATTDTSDSRNTISTEYNDTSNITTQLALNFIDADNDYVTNQIATKRPDAVQTDAIKQVSLPFVMRVADAEKLVNGLLVQGRLSLIVHKFRLPPKYIWLGKGDIIELMHGTFNDIVRITDTDLNADKSQSVTAETVATGKRQVPANSYPSDRTVTGELVASIPLVLDIPAITVGETQGADAIGNFEMYYGVLPVSKGQWQGGYFARKIDDDAWQTLFHVYGKPDKPGDVIFRANAINALTDKRWETDDDPLYLRNMPIEWDTRNNTTKDVIRVDPYMNLAVYGAPGRWEIIQFEAITNGVMHGIVRGLKGTEIYCGQHAANDRIFTLRPGLAMSRLPDSMVGERALNRAVSEGMPFLGGEPTANVFEGNSRRPYAPYHFRAERDTDTGDLALAWNRRDRAGGGWGQTPPMSEAVLAFSVGVCNKDGVLLRTLAATDTTVDYTADMQATDNTTGDTELILRIVQIGDIGPGFEGVERINV